MNIISLLTLSISVFSGFSNANASLLTENEYPPLTTLSSYSVSKSFGGSFFEGIPTEIVVQSIDCLKLDSFKAFKATCRGAAKLSFNPIFYERKGLKHVITNNEALAAFGDLHQNGDFLSAPDFFYIPASLSMSKKLPYSERPMDLRHITGMKHLTIFNCNEIINSDFSPLEGVTKITLISCYNLTNEHMRDYLSEATDLHLFDCNKINVTGLTHLKKAKNIALYNYGLRDNDMAVLGNLDFLRVRKCDHVTNAGFAHLKKLKGLQIFNNLNINDAGLIHLADLEALSISCCPNITNAGLKHLSKIKLLNLSGILNLTDAGLPFLEDVKVVNLGGGRHITEAGKQALRDRGVTVLEEHNDMSIDLLYKNL